MAASTAHRRTSGPELDPDEREAIALALQAFGFYLDGKLLQFLLDRDSARGRRRTES